MSLFGTPDPFATFDLWLLRKTPVSRWNRFLSWAITPAVRREIDRWVKEGKVG